jgi:hypothetical protein
VFAIDEKSKSIFVRYDMLSRLLVKQMGQMDRIKTRERPGYGEHAFQNGCCCNLNKLSFFQVQAAEHL